MTAGGSRVTVYAKSTAVSVTPVKPGKTYPLSVLDRAMSRHTVHLVFYYRPGPAMDRDRLKDSLSEVLSHYPVATGRLTRSGHGGGWMVKCNDAGMRTLDSRAGCTLDRWFETATAEEERELAYWEPMGPDPSIWSPFYVQITEFADKAYAIGLSCTHMHADPTCAVLLLKAWSDLHRLAAVVHPPFFHPPALLPRPTPNPSSPLLSLKAQTTPRSRDDHQSKKMTSATFRFSGAAVRSLLSAAGPDAGPFDALAALFWLRIHGAKSTAALTLCVDFRKLMEAPLPHGFYGNALHFSRAEADLAAGIEHVAGSIRRHVAGLGEEDWWSEIEWLGARGEEEEEMAMYGPELTCVRMEHVMAYGAVFGEGEGARPAHVSCRVGGAEGEGVVVVMPAAEEGGRTVAVTLPEVVTDRICRDESILKHGATVMFKGN